MQLYAKIEQYVKQKFSNYKCSNVNYSYFLTIILYTIITSFFILYVNLIYIFPSGVRIYIYTMNILFEIINLLSAILVCKKRKELARKILLLNVNIISIIILFTAIYFFESSFITIILMIISANIFINDGQNIIKLTVLDLLEIYILTYLFIPDSLILIFKLSIMVIIFAILFILSVKYMMSMHNYRMQNINIGNEYFRTVFKYIPYGVAIINKTGKIEMINKEYANILSYDVDEIIGNSIFNHTHKDDIEGNKLIFKKVLMHEVDYVDLEKRYINKYGKTIWVNLRGKLIDNINDDIKVIAMIRDVTKEKELEIIAMEERKKQELHNRLESLGKLASTTAHDFNNLLSIIQGNIDLMKNIAGSEKYIEYLDEIIDTINKAKEINKQLSSFGKIDKTSYKIINLNNLIIKNKKLLKMGLENKKINLHYQLTENDSYIYAKETQILQIIMNLVINAKEAIKDEGNIWIQTETDNNYAYLLIQDDGPGIDNKYISSIFNPYFTTKKDNSGLGLYIVYNIIIQHGGEISISNNPGKGVKFTLKFPIIKYNTILQSSK